jgi:hypothetical protein
MSAVTFTSEDPLGAVTVDNPPLNLVSHETMGPPDNAIIAAATRGRTGRRSAPDGCILPPRSAQAPARRQRGRTRSGQRGRCSPPGSPSHVDRAGRSPADSLRRCTAGARRAVRCVPGAESRASDPFPGSREPCTGRRGPARQRRQLIATPMPRGPSASRFLQELPLPPRFQGRAAAGSRGAERAGGAPRMYWPPRRTGGGPTPWPRVTPAWTPRPSRGPPSRSMPMTSAPQPTRITPGARRGTSRQIDPPYSAQ